jgi:hypothetical protein
MAKDKNSGKFTRNGEQDESLTALISLRIKPSVKTRLQELPDYRAFIREAIHEKLNQEAL